MSGNVLKGVPPHAGSTAYINARIVDPVGDSEYVGAVLISTALFRICPAYMLFGIRTCEIGRT